MSGPLAGIRVLELGRLMAAPFAGQVLAGLEADVVKIERPGTGDESRAYGDFYFRSLNRGKRSVALDLKTPEGRRALEGLIPGASVFLQNWAPGALERLGFGERDVLGMNPRIVYASVDGFGPHDPGRTGLDMSAQMASGIAALTGEAGRDPVRCGVPVSDLAAGLYAAIGILAKLAGRQGGAVSTSLLEASASLLTYQASLFFETDRSPERLGNAHPSIVPYDAYATADGRVVLAVANDAAFVRLWAALGLAPDPRFSTNPERARHRADLDARLRPAIRARTTEACVRLCREAKVPCDEILELPEVFRRYPGLRQGDHLAPALRMGEGEAGLRPPPALGEHTREVLEGR